MWWYGRSRKGVSGFSSCSTAEEVTDGIDGSSLTAIITGASSGIGRETGRVLALRGVHVIMAIRNMDAGNKVKEAILQEIPCAKIDIMELDLSSFSSITNFAAQFTSSALPLNILINNAGVAPPFTLSEDKIEMQFATNYLGHFLLTNLLLDIIKNTARQTQIQGRIVNVSSLAHRFTYPTGILFDNINDPSSYQNARAYGQSKLANILHANHLARLLRVYILFEEDIVTANSLHPGMIATDLYRHNSLVAGIVNKFVKYVIKNVEQGAATTCYVALHPGVKEISGGYFSDCNLSTASDQANDVQLATKLWDFTIQLLASHSNK
ncbi:short-chain dehydrogenase TIC 32, chloroplastic-like [Impatiens glandulifera]|uniref:short-chain dehydrogenase TIC 32, chloroplastic-like n=1 Tax=Impatiens glandulifera TaxID=253017 RepID=UPI001FB0569C|nr:short-chain dehydrogenase TIC 32, chloroplastic-like [Impatiens glandulifera]